MTQGPDGRMTERATLEIDETDDSDRGWGDEVSTADREADDDDRLTREKPPHW